LVPTKPDFRFEEAVRFRNEFQPTEGVNYDWAFDYAKDSFSMSMEIYRQLDEKASDLIKYLGGGTGLFALAAVANVTKQNAGIVVWVMPSFVLSLISIYFACLARKPNKTRLPASVEAVARYYAEYYKDQAKAKFLGEWHEAIIGMGLANELKSRRVTAATWAFFAAIVMLGAPLLYALHRNGGF